MPEENAALGVPYDTRGAYSNEFLEVLLKLWTEERASYRGEFFAFDDLITSPKPLQRPHPPIMVGGNRMPALRRVARLGNGWHPLALTPEGLRKRLPTIHAQAAEAGREGVPSEIQVRLDMQKIRPELVREYEAAGATELVLSLGTGDVGAIERQIERFAAAMFP